MVEKGTVKENLPRKGPYKVDAREETSLPVLVSAEIHVGDARFTYTVRAVSKPVSILSLPRSSPVPLNVGLSMDT